MKHTLLGFNHVTLYIYNAMIAKLTWKLQKIIFVEIVWFCQNYLQVTACVLMRAINTTTRHSLTGNITVKESTTNKTWLSSHTPFLTLSMHNNHCRRAHELMWCSEYSPYLWVWMTRLMPPHLLRHQASVLLPVILWERKKDKIITSF